MNWDIFHKSKSTDKELSFLKYPINEFLGLLKGNCILDLGCGTSYNSIYFIKNGFKIDCVDYSDVAVTKLNEKIKNYEHNAKLYKINILDFNFIPNKYDLIILSSIMNFFNENDRKTIFDSTYKALKKGGLVYFNAFSTLEMSMEISKKNNLKEIEPNTFKNEDKIVHYFLEDEVSSIFSKYKLILMSQQKKIDLFHGEEHYHNSLLFLGVKN